MNPDTRIAVTAAAYNVAGLACLGLMYVAYRLWIPAQPNLFSLGVSLLGGGFGYLISQGSSVRSQAQLQRILGASLIREKEAEAKTVDEARRLYEQELANLKNIIEREGNQLLLKRMREVQLQEARDRLRQIDSIDQELAKLRQQQVPDEVEQVRKRLEGLLAGVANPEEDDRLIRQLCYSIPLVGNFLYVAYMVAKKVDPTLQDRLHRRLNIFSRGSGTQRPVLRAVVFLVTMVFLLGLVTAIVFIVERVVMR